MSKESIESAYRKLEALGSCRMTLKEVLALAQELIDHPPMGYTRFVPGRLAMTVLDLAIRWPRTAQGTPLGVDFGRDVDPDETILPGTYYAADGNGEALKTYAYEDLDLSAEPWVSYLWGVADQEDLDFDPYDTIEAALDVAADLEELPETIELHPWVRHVPDEGEIQRLTALMLEDLFDRLDEEYGRPDPYGDREEPGERDRREAVRFIKGVVGRMHIWRCDPVPAIVEVDVERWIRENRADWLNTEPDHDQGAPATADDLAAAAVEDYLEGGDE